MSPDARAELRHRGDDARQHAGGRADPPAWAAPTTPARGSASSTGTQSAASTASPIPGRAVTTASAPGGRAHRAAGVDHDHPRAVHLLEEHDRHAQLRGQAARFAATAAGSSPTPADRLNGRTAGERPPARVLTTRRTRTVRAPVSAS